MHRLLALGCVLAMGCANQPTAIPEIAAPTVDAGPPACEALFARMHGSKTRAGDARSWLDAPVRMVEGRRLRSIEARAEALGCRRPTG